MNSLTVSFYLLLTIYTFSVSKLAANINMNSLRLFVLFHRAWEKFLYKLGEFLRNIFATFTFNGWYDWFSSLVAIESSP